MESVLPLADDSQLIELSQDTPKVLFPYLSRADAFVSLIVLLVVFHGVLAFRYSHLADESANRSLAGLAFRQSPSIEGILEPNLYNPDLMSRFAPPLTGWLTTGLVVLFPQFPLLVAPLIALLSAGFLFAVVYVLIREFVNSRVAFLSVVLLGCHPAMIRLSQFASVELLSVGLSLSTFWTFHIHFVRRRGAVSWELLWSGISLGLCLLASGSLAILTAAILFLYALAAVILQTRSSNRGQKRATILNPWMVVPSFLILLLTSFAVAGWWELRMAQHYGQSFWHEWLFNTSSISIPEKIQLEGSLVNGANSELWVWLLNVADQFNWLIGLLLLGACSLLSVRSGNKGNGNSLSRLFLGSWLLVGLFCLGLFISYGELQVSNSLALNFFISIPLFVLVAIALDKINSRDVSLRIILLVVVLPFLLMVFRKSVAADAQHLTPMLMLLVFFAVLVMLTIRFCGNQELRNRVVVLLLTGLLVIGYLGNSQKSIQTADADYATLRKLKHYVSRYDHPIQQVTMLADQAAPPILECWCMGLRPDAGFQVSQLWQPPVKSIDNSELSNELIGSELIVAWGSSDFVNRSSQFPDDELIQIAPPQYFASYELRLFVVGGN